MKTDPLQMLTTADRRLLAERMRSVSYPADAVLLHEGVPRRALMIVARGTVRVERALQGRALVLAQLGEGEVLGEIGFVEDAPPSASVVADGPCVVDVVEGDALQSLIATEPGFAARFYHSIAIALARRTRAGNQARLSVARTASVAQVNRFHVPRTGNITARQIPAALADGLATFERAMLAARLALRGGAPEDTQAAAVAAACDDVVALLDAFTGDDTLVDIGYSDLLSFRDPGQLEAGVGDWIFRETFSTFMQSATMARCYAKPRGFADDHETIARIHANDPEGEDRLGPSIDRWFLGRPLCTARRTSAAAIGAAMAEACDAVRRRQPSQRVRIASLASGHAGELLAFLAANSNHRTPGGADSDAGDVVGTCVDLDDEALLDASRRADASGIGARLRVVEGDVVPADGEGPSLRPHHFVYALGLCEYLRDDQVVTLLDLAWRLLEPGGTVAITNLADGNPDRAVMHHLLDWDVYHRTPAALEALFARSAFAERPVRIAVDPRGADLRAVCTRPD